MGSLELEEEQGRVLSARLVHCGQRTGRGQGFVHDQAEPLVAFYADGELVTLLTSALLERLEDEPGLVLSPDHHLPRRELGRLVAWVFGEARPLRPGPRARLAELAETTETAG